MTNVGHGIDNANSLLFVVLDTVLLALGSGAEYKNRTGDLG